MRELSRRIEKLEREAATVACVCDRAPWIRETYDRFGKLVSRKEPLPRNCSVHGQIQPGRIVRQLVRPKERVCAT